MKARSSRAAMFSSNALHACRSPLPREGEGEGSSNITEAREFENPSPQSSPLLRGERREEPCRLSRESHQSERRGTRRPFRIPKASRLASNLRAAGLCIATQLIAAKLAPRRRTFCRFTSRIIMPARFTGWPNMIDLDQPCTLILFDAHSDASGHFRFR